MLDIAQIESFYPPVLRSFKRNLLREYLQYKILDHIFHSKKAVKLVFMGGTAIHLLHGSGRFSEDLHFDNRGLDFDELGKLGEEILKALAMQGYDIESKIVAKSAWHLHLRFPRILYDSGISGHRDEVLTIQVDTEPQRYDYAPQMVILNKFDVFSRIAVVPAPVLLSQKICCLFTRKRPMGRDIFDIIFLLGKTGPDTAYLKAKLDIGDHSALRGKLLRRCEEIDFKQCARDVEPFLFDAREAEKIEAFVDLVKARF